MSKDTSVINISVMEMSMGHICHCIINLLDNVVDVTLFFKLNWPQILSITTYLTICLGNPYTNTF